MDLRGQTSGMVMNWDVGETETTVTFYDSTETTVLGTMIIENSKMRNLQRSMSEVCENLFPNNDDHAFVKQKTIYNNLTKDAVLKWQP